MKLTRIQVSVFFCFFSSFFSLSFTVLLLFLFTFYEIFLVNFKITWVALLLVFLVFLKFRFSKGNLFLNWINWFLHPTFNFLGVELLGWARVKNLMNCKFESLSQVYKVCIILIFFSPMKNMVGSILVFIKLNLFDYILDI
jgi:hypothetical protein